MARRHTKEGFRRGELCRRVLEKIREAGEPVTPTEDTRPLLGIPAPVTHSKSSQKRSSSRPPGPKSGRSGPLPSLGPSGRDGPQRAPNLSSTPYNSGFRPPLTPGSLDTVQGRQEIGHGVELIGQGGHHQELISSNPASAWNTSGIGRGECWTTYRSISPFKAEPALATKARPSAKLTASISVSLPRPIGRIRPGSYPNTCAIQAWAAITSDAPSAPPPASTAVVSAAMAGSSTWATRAVAAGSASPADSTHGP